MAPQSTWWRWPLMPVAALAAAILGACLVWAFFWFQSMLIGFSPNGWYYTFVMPWMATVVFGYFLASVAYKVAPAGKVIASSVMATVVCLAGLITVVSAYFAPDPPTAGLVLVTGALPALIFGCAFGMSEAISGR